MNALVPTPDVIAEAKRIEQEMELRLIDEAARDQHEELFAMDPFDLDTETRVRRKVRGER